MDAGSTSDQDLLEQYRLNQSQSAFAELVRRHLNLVYYTALRRVNGDSPLAEEVTQSVFQALATKASDAQRRPVLAAWLYRSTRFAAAQAVRTESRRRRRESIAFALDPPQPSSPPAWAGRGPELDEALEALPRADRELVLLRFFEGRPLSEVGACFSITADAARMRIDRALEKLRLNLARRGIVSTAAAIAAGCCAQAGQTVPLGLAAKTLGSVVSCAPAIATGSAGLFSVIVAAGWKWAIAAALIAIGSIAVVESHTLSRIAPAPSAAGPAAVGLSSKFSPAESADSRPSATIHPPSFLNRHVQQTAAATTTDGLSDEQLGQVLRTSPVVVNQVGEVRRVRRLGSQHKVMRRRATGEVVGYAGSYRYQVDGADLSRSFQIDWERIPTDSPTRITQVLPSTPTGEPGLPDSPGRAQLAP